MKDNNRIVYLDNAATTKVSDEVVALFVNSEKDNFANPNSIHALGIKNAKKVQVAKENILKSFRLNKHKVILTSSATEANNLAIKGYCLKYANRGKHIITTNIEHPSVLECFYQLKDQFGYKVTVLEVNSKGYISASQVKEAMDKDTILVSVMAVNNEIGSINPINEIADVVHAYPKANLHVDTTQAIGKINLDYSKIDMFVVSSHKIHGLKGSGALIYKSSLSFLPLLSGGGQEDGFRSSTVSVANAETIALAIKDALKEDRNTIKELRSKLVEGLSKIDGIELNSDEGCSPYIVSFSLTKKKASVVVEDLSNKGIYVSSVSACNSKKEPYSYVVKALGKSDALAHNTIRISFSKDNTLEDVELFLKELKNTLEAIR